MSSFTPGTRAKPFRRTLWTSWQYSHNPLLWRLPIAARTDNT